MQVSERAGTHLSTQARPLRLGGRTLGMIDPLLGLYQFGGSKQTFVLRRLQVVGLGAQEWEVIRSQCSEIEFIEHDQNECWAISVERATEVGRHYNAGAGDRFGIPTTAFDVFDAEGNLQTEGR